MLTMDDSRLIELVRGYPVLYDLSNSKYMDTDYKNSVWIKIGEDIGATGLCSSTLSAVTDMAVPGRPSAVGDNFNNGQLCKSRWSNIRDNFRKSLKKKAKSGKVYKYSEELSFLKGFFNELETASNIGDEVKSEPMLGDEEENEFSDENIDTEQVAAQVDSPVFRSQFNRLSTLIRRNPSQNLKKRKLSSQRSSLLKSAASTVLEHLIQQKESTISHSTQLSTPPDPVDAFLSGIAPVLKQLPPRYWHHAKTDLFSVVQKYELIMIQEEEQSRESSSLSHYPNTEPSPADALLLQSMHCSE